MKNNFIILLFSILSITAISQESPTLICLDVNENGDVNLHWLPPSIISGLIKYNIYYFDGTYIKIGDVGANINTFLHNGAQADIKSQSYYIEAEYSLDSISSAVLNTIYLQVGISADFNEAILYWNHLGDPWPAGSNRRKHLEIQ